MLRDLGDKISKKEFIYIFILIQLVEAVILVSVWRADAATLINQVVLGSSITSILLAFLAIVYAFIQAGDVARQNLSTQQILNEISERVAELNRIEDGLEDIISNISQIADGITKINKRIDDNNEIINIINNDFDVLIRSIQLEENKLGEDHELNELKSHVRKIAEDVKRLNMIKEPLPTLPALSKKNKR